jgi:UDP-N-acetylglucosamine 2-epimerase
MSGSSQRLVVRGPRAGREVELADYLESRQAEAAERDGNRWIKSLRHAKVDGVPLRDRFMWRGDSLWWFAELYLHKIPVAATILRTVAAVESLIARESPSAVEIVSGDEVLRFVAPLVAARHGVTCRGTGSAHGVSEGSRLDLAARSTFYAASAFADRLRPGSRVRRAPLQSAVAAFVHSAFWRHRPGAGDEAYIGPVLRAVAERLGPDQLQLVGVGPRTNFRVRAWQHRLAEFGDPWARAIPLTPVATYGSLATIRPSLAFWAERGSIRRALWASRDLREAAVVGGCDAWPLIRRALAGVSHLQFPWSVQAMEQAGAALDVLRPAVALTYAEAGGWGRALMLEARRRGIPSVGVQHGFIYRHWLNYLHEPDEMIPSPGNPGDRGFPRPDLTLVYDEFAREHLMSAGGFPEAAIRVVGSPRLDRFVETSRHLSEEDAARLRESLGAGPGQHVIVVATKYSQIAPAFGVIVRAAADLKDVRLVVKCHPAEGPEPYLAAAGGSGIVGVAPGDADLAALVSVARLLVTVNSTAAIEAMPLDVPALVVALPNNLSPFVAAGAMAGVESNAGISPALVSLLYDEEHRARLAAARRAFMERFGIRPDGRAATRAAEAVASLLPKESTCAS